MALNGLFCDGVPLRNYSIFIHSVSTRTSPTVAWRLTECLYKPIQMGPTSDTVFLYIEYRMAKHRIRVDL